MPRRWTRIGQDRLGQRDAVLHQHLADVQVGAGLERHGQRVVAVVGALRRHVQHVLDAVDLLLDRRGHGVGHGLGVGAGIVGRHLDGRRRDVRVLRDRQREQGDAAAQRDDDRQHRGEDRPVDEKAREHAGSLLPSRSNVLVAVRPVRRWMPLHPISGAVRLQRRRRGRLAPASRRPLAERAAHRAAAPARPSPPTATAARPDAGPGRGRARPARRGRRASPPAC